MCGEREPGRQAGDEWRNDAILSELLSEEGVAASNETELKGVLVRRFTSKALVTQLARLSLTAP